MPVAIVTISHRYSSADQGWLDLKQKHEWHGFRPDNISGCHVAQVDPNLPLLLDLDALYGPVFDGKVVHRLVPFSMLGGHVEWGELEMTRLDTGLILIEFSPVRIPLTWPVQTVSQE